MAKKVNVELLAKAYCEVLTRNTGIQHYYTIKKDISEKGEEKCQQ